MPAVSATKFLNVDLDVEASQGIRTLLNSLVPNVLIMNETSTRASVELSREVAGPDDAITGFIALIEALPAEARLIWDGAEKRRMNVGIQAGAKPYSAEFALSKECIASLQRIGAEIVSPCTRPP